MATIHSFITSETTQVLQFLLTLGVITVLLILCVQVNNRLRCSEREKLQLKREFDELQNYSDRALMGVREALQDHGNLLRQIGAQLHGGHVVAIEDFDALGDFPGDLAGEVRIDFAGLEADSDRQEPLMSTDIAAMQSAPLQQDADVSFPMRAEVTNIMDSARFNGPEQGFDDRIDEEPDPLTRAIEISRARR